MKQLLEKSVPVVVFGYNRPDHLRKTMEALSSAVSAKSSPVWLFCDGPKDIKSEKAVGKVRALAHESRWKAKFGSVTVVEAEVNKGLARSIIDGVSAVMDSAGSAIVVEDDLLVAPDFLRFMNECLEFYKDDHLVGSVTGFSPLAGPPTGYSSDVMAIPRNCSHGWATWADRWAKVDWDALGAANLSCDKGRRRRFNAAGNDRFYRLQRQLAGEIDSWSIRFGLWQSLSGRHTIYPVENRVRNIGFDGSGVHTRDGQDVNPNALCEARPFRLEQVVPDPAIVRKVARIYEGAWPKRILRDFRAWLRRSSARKI